MAVPTSSRDHQPVSPAVFGDYCLASCLDPLWEGMAGARQVPMYPRVAGAFFFCSWTTNAFPIGRQPSIKIGRGPDGKRAVEVERNRPVADLLQGSKLRGKPTACYLYHAGRIDLGAATSVGSRFLFPVRSFPIFWNVCQGWPACRAPPQFSCSKPFFPCSPFLFRFFLNKIFYFYLFVQCPESEIRALDLIDPMRPISQQVKNLDQGQRGTTVSCCKNPSLAHRALFRAIARLPEPELPWKLHSSGCLCPALPSAPRISGQDLTGIDRQQANHYLPSSTVECQ